MQNLVRNILTLQDSLPCPLVGMSGIDSSGKSYLAGKLVTKLAGHGLKVALIRLDLFHNPPAVRFAEHNPAKQFYEQAFDFDRLFNRLLEPLRRDRTIDITLEVTRLPKNEVYEQRFSYQNVDLILLEGILLFKNTLKGRFDYRIWVDCSFRTALQRAPDRHQEGLSREETIRDYAEIYHAAQKQHYAIDQPKASADNILINDPLLERGPEFLLAQPAAGGQLNESLQWFNEPATWRIEDSTIIIQPEAITDFWQRTHYGFQNDNGHFLYLETDKDFVMQTQTRFKPVHQFDQCGLMVRLDQDNWLKTSIEYQLENPASMGAVVTNLGYSDWSIQSVADQIEEAWFRIERDGHDFVIDASFDGEVWERIRVCRLHHANGAVKCGLYCCSPIGAGYEVLFDQLEVRELII